MKIHDQLLYRRAKELGKTNYGPAGDRKKRIFNHAVSYMKKCKQSKVFKDTYFTDPETTAEELESIIYLGTVAGDSNYDKHGKTEHHDRYLNISIRNHLCKYLKHRIDWEKHYTFVDFDDPENDWAGECCCLVPPSLDISDFNFTGLTDRQIQSVIYYTYGFKDDYVAEVLGLSKNTVRTNRRRGLTKMRKTNNHLCKYLKHRIDWEDHYTFVDFDDPENDWAEECCYLIPPSLDVSGFSFTGLSDREIQAVIYYKYGFHDDYVADVLNLAINTIKTFRRRGLEKMRRTNNHQKMLNLSQPIIGE